MIFPSIEEYKDALRIAEHSLKTLHDYEPVVRDDGDLWFSSGNFAVVFKVRHRTTGRLLALKCFTRHQDSRAESYRLITEWLKDYPGDYLVRYEYLDEELWVNSRAAGERDFPVLAMDWVEGVTLGEYVRTCCARDDRAALQKLIEEFNWFAFWLLSQPFAHGDLKPDNIVVRPDGKPVLLDYDGMYVPAMKGQPARELGSPVYCHPARTVEVFDKRIDDFGLLVLLLELRLLAAAPAKHAGRGGSESLYFQADELRGQHWRTGLPQMDVLQHLLRCFDAALDGETVDLATLLFAALRGDTPPAPPPEEKPYVGIGQRQFEWEPVPNASGPHAFRMASFVAVLLVGMGLGAWLLKCQLEREPEPAIVIERTTPLPDAIKKLGADMVAVAGGTFTMGCQDANRDGDCYDWEKPPRRVTVRDFAIGRYEVTQAQWRAVMGSNPPNLYNIGCDDCPVEGISWNDVQEFLKELNRQTKKTYCLPTEAEWEYAARGGNKSQGYLYSGSNNLDEVGWYGYGANAQKDNTFGSKKTTRPVGKKKANELGLYDMSGNVWEWCADDWHDSYNGTPTDGRAWVDSPRGVDRVFRGGSWFSTAGFCRAALRNYVGPAYRYNYVGFRLAL